MISKIAGWEVVWKENKFIELIVNEIVFNFSLNKYNVDFLLFTIFLEVMKVNIFWGK